MRGRAKQVLSSLLLVAGLLIVGVGVSVLRMAHEIAELEGRIVVPLPTEGADERDDARATPTPLTAYTPTPARARPLITAVVAANFPPTAPPPLPALPPAALLPIATGPLSTATALPTPIPMLVPPPTPATEPPPTEEPPPLAATATSALVVAPPTAMVTLAPPPLVLMLPPATEPIREPVTMLGTVFPTPSPTNATSVALSPPTGRTETPVVLPPPASPPPPAATLPRRIVTPQPTVVLRPPFTVAPTPVAPTIVVFPTVLAWGIVASPSPLTVPSWRATPTAIVAPNAGGVLRGGASVLTGESDGREAVWGGRQVVRILLLGVDRRDNEPARSDTMILATVDLWNGTVNLLSIPRDLVVPITGYGEDRVNAAFAYGQADRPHDPAAGPALAVKTVSRQFGVPVDHYLFVDFKGFKEIVDAVGGVDIVVPHAIDDDEYPTDDYRTIRLHFNPGKQHMDGAVALTYARTRHGDDDNARRERQMQVMQAVLTRGIEVDGIRHMPEVVKRLGTNMQTSLPYEAQVSLATMAKKFQANGVVQYSIKPPLVTGTSGTIWGDVYMGNWEAIRAFVAEATDPRRRPRR